MGEPLIERFLSIIREKIREAEVKRKHLIVTTRADNFSSVSKVKL